VLFEEFDDVTTTLILHFNFFDGKAFGFEILDFLNFFLYTRLYFQLGVISLLKALLL